MNWMKSTHARMIWLGVKKQQQQKKNTTSQVRLGKQGLEEANKLAGIT